MKRIALILCCAAIAAAQPAPKADMCAPPPGANPPALPAKIIAGQGSEYIHFRITTKSDEAQKFFTQGVAQMHSFSATEAERSFLHAASLDPEAPMPWWGVAMVASGDYRPHFQLVRDTSARTPEPAANAGPTGGAKRAIEAAAKARQLAEVPGRATPIEKLYIESIAARREQAKTLDERNAGYIAGLRAVLKAAPDEVEAASFLALHLMMGFSTPDKTPRPGSIEAADLLREYVKKFPEHPGIHHYIIHGFEGSTFASEGWPSCRRYPELAANIPHALHMPGHIWAQTGKWTEAIQSFSAAAANERTWMSGDRLYGSGHHGHNVHFLVSALAFEGRHEEAMKYSAELLAIKESPREEKQIDNFRTAHRQGWFSRLATLVHGEKWDAILDGSSLPEYNKPREQAWRAWALGLAHAAKKDPKAAKADRKAMDRVFKTMKKRSVEVPASLIVARQELEAQIAAGRRKTDKALRLFAAASTAERGLRYNEPPSYPRPVSEAWGAYALASGRAKDAEAAFKIALAQYPESKRAKSGLAQATQPESKAVTAGGE